MSLDIDALLGINVDISFKEPILQKVTNEDMIKYLKANDFTYSLTHEPGLDVYVHSSVKIQDDETEYLFDLGIDTTDDGSNPYHHAANVLSFIDNMRRFYQLKDNTSRTQLQILNELL